MAYNATQKYAPWIMSPFLESIGILADLGIVFVDENKSIIGEGDFIQIPKISDISDFQRRNITTTGATRAFTEMGNTMETGVILHDDIADKYLIGQESRTGAKFGPEWGARMGLKWFRRAKQQLYRVAKAAIEACDTTDGSTASANVHISDCFSATSNNTMTYTRLQDAKAKMGDRAGDLTVAVMHSTCWNNLVKDGISNYKIDDVAGRLIGIGGLTAKDITEIGMFGIARFEALGLVIIIDDDMTASTLSGSTYTYGSKYETLILGPDALYLGYQRNVTVSEDDDLADARGAAHRMRAEVDYCAHLFGVEWDVTTTNPTDTQLGTKSNWDEAYENHKEVKCVKLVTNG